MKRKMYLVIKKEGMEYAGKWTVMSTECTIFSNKENAEKYIRETMHKEFEELSNDDNYSELRVDEEYNEISYHAYDGWADRVDSWRIEEIEVQDEEV